MAVLQKLILMYLLLINSAYAAEGMPQFNAKTFPSQLFWLVISFLVLYFFITFLVLPRIRENIRLRKNKVLNDIDRAENLKKDIEEMILEYDGKISEAKDQVSKMIKKSILKSTEDFKRQVTIVKKQIDNKHIEVEKNIGNYKNKIEKDMLDSTASISSQIIKKIIDKNVPNEEIKSLLIKNNYSDGV
jgi:F-type H+-transporting ATPase subunit b